jgi:hypothetical protein
MNTPGLPDTALARVKAVSDALREVREALSGDPTLSRRAMPEPPSILGRIGTVVDGLSYVTSPPTGTQVEQYGFAADAFESTLAELKRIVDTDLPALEREFDAAGAPWTPARFPVWTRE